MDLAVVIGTFVMEVPMNRRMVVLDESTRRALERIRDTAPKGFQRERAAAVLKVAQGMPAYIVAADLLYKPRARSTVCEWLDRFETEGIEGLLGIRPGRGRKPAFPPRGPRQGRGPTEGSGEDPPRDPAGA